MAARATLDQTEQDLRALTDRLFERGHRSAVLPEEYAAALARQDKARKELRAAIHEMGRR